MTRSVSGSGFLAESGTRVPGGSNHTSIPSSLLTGNVIRVYTNPKFYPDIKREILITQVR